MLFEELGLISNIIILIVSFLVLDQASDLVIINSVKISDIAGYGRATIGFILLSFLTSLSALFVSVFSVAIEENIGMAVGNALGSNIANICLILGISIIIATLKKPEHSKFLQSITKEEIRSLYFGLFIASTIPLTLIYVGYASRLIGIILLAVFAVYIFRTARNRTTKEVSELAGERENLRKFVFLTLFGVAIVMGCSFFIVNSASNIAISIGIPRIVIGATVVAFGTSIPILLASLRAVQKGHLDLALGNVVGTCFMDTTCILGITLVLSALRVEMVAFSSLVMFSVIATLFLWYFLSSESIGRREGAVLLFMYFLYLAISFSGLQT